MRWDVSDEQQADEPMRRPRGRHRGLPAAAPAPAADGWRARLAAAAAPVVASVEPRLAVAAEWLFERRLHVLIVAASVATIAMIGGAVALISFAGAPQPADEAANVVETPRPTSTDPASPNTYAPILPESRAARRRSSRPRPPRRLRRPRTSRRSRWPSRPSSRPPSRSPRSRTVDPIRPARRTSPTSPSPDRADRRGRRSSHPISAFGFVTFRIHSPFRFAWSARLSPTPTVARHHRTMGTPVTMRTAEYPRPDHFLLHISDTHLLAGGGRLYDRVASEQHLRTLFEEFEASGARPEAIVFTGDLADLGEPDAYDRIRAHRRARRRRASARRSSGSWATTTTARRSAAACSASPLGGYRAGRSRRRAQRPAASSRSTRPCPGTTTARSRPPSSTGSPRSSRSPAPHGTILAMHHPPVPSVLDLAARVELRDQAGLAEVLEGTDVRAIIAGHLHYSTIATFAGIPVSVASATCYTQDLTVPVGGTRGRDGAQAFNLVHVYPTTVVHSVVPVDAPRALELHRRRPRAQRRLARHAGIAARRVPSRRSADGDRCRRREPIAVLRLTSARSHGARTGNMRSRKSMTAARALLDRDLGEAAVVEAEHVLTSRRFEQLLHARAAPCASVVSRTGPAASVCTTARPVSSA